jgi:hypothetical protein
MNPGDTVQVTWPSSSFKGCIGVILRAHDKFGNHWWIQIEGWSPMVFPTRGLQKV